jgi:site-specific recombinase XerD
MTVVSSYIAKFGLMVAENQVPFKGLRLFVSPEADKQSYVEFYVWHDVRNLYVRKRIIIAAQTLASRKKKGELELQFWKEQLRKGVHFTELLSKSNTISGIDFKTEIRTAAEHYIIQKTKILSKNSIKGYKADVLRLKNYLEKQNKFIAIGKLDEIEAHAFLDYLTNMPDLSNRSINNTLNGLTTLYNYYIDRKVISDNPFKKIKRLPDIARKHTAMPAEVCRKILAEADPQLQLFCQMIYYCMIRPGRELIGLQLKHIHATTIEIVAEKSKNRTTEHIGIPVSLQKILKQMNLSQYPQEYYLFGNDTSSRKANNVFQYDYKPAITAHYDNYFYKKHKAILDKLDLDKFGYDLYCWKHSGVIALFQACQNMEVVRRQCRHADLSATQKYLRDLGQFVDYSEINKVPSLL